MVQFSPQDEIDMNAPALDPPAQVPAPQAAKTPSFMDWLGSPEAMAFASGLLKASGPSPVPISMGQAIGMGMEDMLKAKLQFGNQGLDKDKFGYQQKHDAQKLGLDYKQLNLAERRELAQQRNWEDQRKLQERQIINQENLTGLHGGLYKAQTDNLKRQNEITNNIMAQFGLLPQNSAEPIPSDQVTPITPPVQTDGGLLNKDRVSPLDQQQQGGGMLNGGTPNLSQPPISGEINGTQKKPLKLGDPEYFDMLSALSLASGKPAGAATILKNKNYIALSTQDWDMKETNDAQGRKINVWVNKKTRQILPVQGLTPDQPNGIYSTLPGGDLTMSPGAAPSSSISPDQPNGIYSTLPGGDLTMSPGAAPSSSISPDQPNGIYGNAQTATGNMPTQVQSGRQIPQSQTIQQPIPTGLRSRETPSMVSDNQTDIVKSYVTLDKLDQIANTYADDLMTYKGNVKNTLLKVADKAGIINSLPTDYKDFLQRSSRFKTTVNQFFNQYRKDITGAQAGMVEIQYLKDSIFNEDRGPTDFRAAFDEFKQGIVRGLSIKQQMIREGIPAGSKTFGPIFDRRWLAGEGDVLPPEKIGANLPATATQTPPDSGSGIMAAHAAEPPSSDIQDMFKYANPAVENFNVSQQQHPVSQNPQSNPSIASKIIGGGYQGLKEFGQGLDQLGLQAGEYLGLADKGRAKNYTQQVEQQRRDYEKTPIGQSTIGGMSRFAGNVAPYVAGSLVAAPVTSTIKTLEAAKAAYPLISRSLGMAGLGYLAGGASFTPEDQSRSDNALMGAAFGGILPSAGVVANKTTGGLLSKIPQVAKPFLGGGAGAGIGYGIDKSNELQGKDTNYTTGLGLLGTGLGTGSAILGKLRTPSPNAKSVIDMGQKYNVPVLAADVSKKNGVIDQATTFGENVPFGGVVKARTKQMNAAQSGAEKIADTYKDTMINADFGGKDGLAKLQTVAQGNGIRAGKAQEILSDIENAGDDWNRIIKTSGNVSLFTRKLVSDDKYDRVTQLAQQFGAVPKINTIEAIKKGIQENSTGILPDKALNNKLQTILTNIESKDMNYDQMRDARSVVSGIIDDYYTGNNAAVGSKGVGAIQNIKSSIEQDMNEFANTHSPELRTAWKEADSYYRKEIVPFKTSELAKSLKGAKADEIYSQFIKNGTREGAKGTSRATGFYEALDDKGRAAVRYGMIENALATATKEGEKGFSPAQFASSIEKIGAGKGVFFKGLDKIEIDGFTNLMRHIERAGQMTKPDTGVKQVAPYLVGSAAGAGLVTGFPVLTTYAGFVAPMRALLTTQIGRKILVSSSRLQPGSPQMNGVIGRFNKLINSNIVQSTATAGAAMPRSNRDRSYE